MDQLSILFKALSDRNRLRIVAALFKHEELCACQLVALLQVTGATASRHMAVLTASGLVESRKEGRWVFYRLRREQAHYRPLLKWIESQLDQQADLAQDRIALDNITSCDPKDLCKT